MIFVDIPVRTTGYDFMKHGQDIDAGITALTVLLVYSITVSYMQKQTITVIK